MASHLAFKSVNCSAGFTPPSPTSASFTLSSTAPTDIWRKPGPPEINTFNAPIIYKQIPLASFQRVRVTISANWQTLYDQGGLVFALPSTASDEGVGNGKSLKWIKSGIEFYQGEPYVSTVAADRWADWSLVQTGLKKQGSGKTEVTLEMERKKDDGTLWIFVVDGDKRIPIREVTWMLSEGDDREAWVGIYIANPTVSGGKELVVDFKGWELEIV